MSEVLYHRSAGSGPAIVFVHGSAADADGWVNQIRGLKSEFEIFCVDRRGSKRSPLPEGQRECSVDDQARDLGLWARETLAGPAVFVGSSFGAVCVLQLAKTQPELMRGMVLCEPPLAPQDDMPPVVTEFIENFERLYETESGAAAARFFLQTVLGPRDYDKMPDNWRVRAEKLAPQIRLDVHALGAYRPEFERLKSVKVPALMVGAERSEAYFIYTLERLRMVLPDSARLTLKEAGHMMHLDQTEGFNQTIKAFVLHFICGPSV